MAKKESISKKDLLFYYEDMVRIRKFEQQASAAFTQGELAGNIHLCIGQEATAVGACAALEERDFITSTHRGHGHCIAKGARTDLAMAELFGKETGYCGGKGGSMHIVDVSKGILGANGIVGAGISIATGSALTSHIEETDEVTLCFFGDGASNQGVFHESINMAATWNLPVVYLIENNQYGVSVNINNIINTKTIAERSVAYNIPGVTINGNDVLAVREAAKTAVDRARAGKGPSIVECLTYRHMGHYMGDNSWYRDDEYMIEAEEKDAIRNYGEYLLKNGFKQSDLDETTEKVEAEIAAAYEFAKSSPYPSLDVVLDNVYSSDNERCVIR